MKELDLDELDQAVNKLMGDASKAKPKQDSEASALAKPASAPVDDKADDDTTRVTVHRVPLQIPPRSKGVAMDIVQAPGGAPVDPPSARAARVAPTLHPMKLVAPDAEAKPDEPKTEAKGQVSNDTLASLNMKDEPDVDMHKSAWPDPLDVHGFKDETKPPDLDDPEPKKDAEPTMHHDNAVVAPLGGDENKDDEKTDEPDESSKSPEVTNSPFLTTKVEKRPLGAFADANPPSKETEPEEKPAEDSSKQEASSVPVQEEPEELSPEVVAVESAEPEFTPAPNGKSGSNEANDMNSLRQMSIPQQYHAEEKAPSKEDRPVFDTKQYHPPLEPVETVHHSGMRMGTVLTVILILLILGAAVFAYFVITGSVDISRLL